MKDILSHRRPENKGGIIIMSKKKHKNKKHEKKEERYLTMDDVITEKHDEAIEEIMKLKKKIKKKDKKVKKKTKKSYNGILSKYSPTAEMEKVRLDAYKHMKKIDLLGTIEELFKNAGPIIKTIARLVASLITLFFQCKTIRELVPMKFLAKMERIYQFAMAI